MSKSYTFKSKYRDDVLSLDKGTIHRRADGSSLVEGRVDATFSHNTFTTHDEELAQKIRDVITTRKTEGRPLGIFETTNEKPISADGTKVRKGVKSA